MLYILYDSFERIDKHLFYVILFDVTHLSVLIRTLLPI